MINKVRGLFIVLMLLSLQLPAQFNVKELGEEGNINTLVRNTFAGSGIKVVKVNYIGNNEAIGSFTDQLGLTGFRKGLIIANGRVELVAGKNARENTSTNFGDAFFADKHVKTKSPLCDGAVLEIDFIPLKDSIALSLVFGSDEYPEFVGKEFNDVFKVILQPVTSKGVARNIARIGKRNISINSINKDSNHNLYIDNSDPANPYYQYIEFDGFTRPLNIGARVERGKTYRLRILVVDLEDCEYDSGILFDAYSFRSLALRPKKFPSVSKKYLIRATGTNTGAALKKQCAAIIDSLKQFTYDSIMVSFSFHDPVDDTLHEELSALFHTPSVRCNHTVIKSASDSLLSSSMIKLLITAYRKPE